MHDESDLEEASYPELYLEGIRLFNQCYFFESHEAWEEIWTEVSGPSRKFYQGLIQAAVALHHFGNGNIRGARKVYFGSRGYLEPYRPSYMGLNVDRFVTEMERCFEAVIASGEDYPKLEIDPELIPEIHLAPPSAS